MKFSEQVLLGSTLIQFNTYNYLTDGCGCLIGMAGASQGETCFDQIWSNTAGTGWYDGIAHMLEVFPWLDEYQPVQDIFGTEYECPRYAINHSADALRDEHATFEQVMGWLQDEIDPIQEEWDRTHEPHAVETPEPCFS